MHTRTGTFAVALIALMVAQLDAQTNALYRKALSVAADPGGIRATHEDWVQLQRDKCSGAACLRAAYRSEIAELRSWTAP